ncbi:uncharacterized protein LOC125386852 [Bombus terrestris]|uniref:Uncharacterized protein LOC125386852 n=1 Tax=Bombus terrestris TaxID=30195 RepID=A0A9C6SJ55_BOMTE|nr:uncharacterized protein LOC125386852 [Bombus terrestris]
MPTYRVTGFNCRITGGLVIQIENDKLDDKRLTGTMVPSGPARVLPAPRSLRQAHHGAASYATKVPRSGPTFRPRMHHACGWENGTARHRNSALDEPPPISISGSQRRVCRVLTSMSQQPSQVSVSQDSF